MIPSDRICYPFHETSSEDALALAKTIQRMSVYIYGTKGSSENYSGSDSYYMSRVWIKEYSRSSITVGISAPSVSVEEASVVVSISPDAHGSISKRFSITDSCTGFITAGLETSYIRTLPQTSVSLGTDDLVLRPELSHVFPIQKISFKSYRMSFDGSDTGESVYEADGDLVLKSGNNVSLSLLPNGNISISSGPGMGAGSSETPPWVGASSSNMYVGVMSINGINNGGDVNIALSNTAIQYGAKIVDGNGAVIVGPAEET